MIGASVRVVGIDVLRALAVTGVLAAHFRVAMGLVKTPDGIVEQTVWNLAQVGNHGVILFFAISGFVITSTTARRDGDLARIQSTAFYARRVARIAPALLLSLCLGNLILCMAPRSSAESVLLVFGDAPFTATFWVSIATFTFNFVRFQTLLCDQIDWGAHWSVLWSLSVEEQFYLVFPWLMRFSYTRRRAFALIAALVVIGIGSREALKEYQEFSLLLTPNFVDVLAVGVGAALIPRFHIDKQRARQLSLLGFIVLICGLLPASWDTGPLLIGLGAVVVMLCCENGQVFTRRVWQPIARLGRVSYGMYLFHSLVLWALFPILAKMPFLAGFTIFLVATVLLAEISFALVERPAAAWILKHWPVREKPKQTPQGWGPARAKPSVAQLGLDYPRTTKIFGHQSEKSQRSVGHEM